MKTYTIEIVTTDIKMKHHPKLKRFCKRKRKRWLRRLKKQGIDHFTVNYARRIPHDS